jgi:hypothetical protein
MRLPELAGLAELQLLVHLVYRYHKA